jgi:hypothetical protein
MVYIPGADSGTSAALKCASPEGVYATITPGNPTLWSGVLFVREGCKPRLSLLTNVINGYSH